MMSHAPKPAARAGGPSPALAVEDLDVWFGPPGKGGVASHVVRGLSIGVAAGECLGLVGESGSGKTTTALAAMGLLPHHAVVSGRILLNGQDILAGGDASVAPHRWKDIAMVFQGAMNAFNPVRTIGWQIAEAIRLHDGDQSRAAIRSRVSDLLDLVGIAGSRARSYPLELSGGMRQRAMIAMALSSRPAVLLADEPTTALDPHNRDQVLGLLGSLRRAFDLAVILVTHDLAVVAAHCDRAAVMRSGEVVEQGRVVDLCLRPAHQYTSRLFGSLSAEAAAKPSATSPASGVALLEVEGLHVHYSTRRSLGQTLGLQPRNVERAVRDVSFTVGRGEIVAVVGQSGAGKSSILQAVMGVVQPVAGTIRLRGRQIAAPGGRPVARRDIQMIFQDPFDSLSRRFCVRDTLGEPLRIAGIGERSAASATLICDMLERVGLTPAARFLDRFSHELSGGQQQRVAIAAAMILKPTLLLADEPVSMLDVSVRSEILELLSNLARDTGAGILMITHDILAAVQVADRIIVVREGGIVEQGDARTICADPAKFHTRALLDCVPRPSWLPALAAATAARTDVPV